VRTRIIQAFSGNNSGAYVLVGTFREVERAAALAGDLAEVFAQQAAWLDAQREDRAPSTPLHDYAAVQGITTSEQAGAGDDWPEYGTLPSVLASGGQLLVFVDYAVTFPGFLGELVYKRGGRVSVELDHSHHPIVLVHEIWKDGGWNDAPAAEAALSAFRMSVENDALAPLYGHPDGLGLSEATELVQRAPIEVLLHVSQHDAHAARDALLAVGADAEALGPQHFSEA